MSATGEIPPVSNRGGISATDLSLATGQSDVHETAGVCESLLRAALGGLGLLLLLDLCEQMLSVSDFPFPVVRMFEYPVPEDSEAMEEAQNRDNLMYTAI